MLRQIRTAAAHAFCGRSGDYASFVTAQNDGLPVRVIDGARFSDFEGFAREFSGLLCDYEWQGNLDAFNDLLWGGFGTPDENWVLRWLNSESSRTALGYEATVRQLEAILLTCHPSNRSQVRTRISQALSSKGPTLFDEIVDIIRKHGPGGHEAEGGVFLELA
jgi:hypothetical protein